MKCVRCGSENPPSDKFCGQCGMDLKAQPGEAPSVFARLLNREVRILFYFEDTRGEKISGIVNPTLEEIEKYQDSGVVQTVRITPDMGERPESILPFIKQSKEFLGEPYDEAQYRNWDTKTLKKEFLRLFERVLKAKEKRQDAMRGTQPKS